MRALLGLRDARLYLIAQVLSSFGDTVMWLAMGIWVKTLTGSNGAAGLVFFAFAFPQLFAPLSGLAVDRLPRRPLLVVTNLALAAVVLALLLVHGRQDVWLIYAVMALYGAGYTILSAGESALLQEFVPDELLGTANSLLSTAQAGFRLFGPLTGAGLFAAFGGGPVALLDALTFLAAAAAMLALHVSTAPAADVVGQWRTDLVTGFRHIAVTPALRQVVGSCAVAFAVIGIVESAAFAVVAALHQPPTFVAVIVVAQGVGAVPAGMCAAALMRRIGEVALTAWALVLLAIGLATLAVPQLGVVLAAAFVMGAGLPWLAIGPMTLVQRASSPAIVGRVSAATNMLIGTPQTISIAAGAGLVSIIDYRVLLIVIGIIVAAAALRLFTSSTAAEHPDIPAAVTGSV